MAVFAAALARDDESFVENDNGIKGISRFEGWCLDVLIRTLVNLYGNAAFVGK